MIDPSDRQDKNGPRAQWAADGVLAAARECLRGAIDIHFDPRSQTRDMRASDAGLRKLSDCVQDYARVLAELGHDERSLLETILGVFDDAAFPDEPHPALRLAVADCAVEALDQRRPESGGSAA
jgi:hypothetical protein